MAGARALSGGLTSKYACPVRTNVSRLWTSFMSGQCCYSNSPTCDSKRSGNEQGKRIVVARRWIYSNFGLITSLLLDHPAVIRICINILDLTLAKTYNLNIGQDIPSHITKESISQELKGSPVRSEIDSSAQILRNVRHPTHHPRRPKT